MTLYVLRLEAHVFALSYLYNLNTSTQVDLLLFLVWKELKLCIAFFFLWLLGHSYTYHLSDLSILCMCVCVWMWVCAYHWNLINDLFGYNLQIIFIRSILALLIFFFYLLHRIIFTIELRRDKNRKKDKHNRRSYRSMAWFINLSW